MGFIPARRFVNVTPGVIGAGGTGKTLTGMFLTTNPQVPLGATQPFADPIDVGTYFGPNSLEAEVAATYFAGYTNGNTTPGQLYFTQYNQSAVAAYLRGGPITALTLAQLGALSGSLSVIMDGYTHTAASINLTGVSSYANAAAIINTALNASEPQEATASACTISGTTLTVGGTLTGEWAPGQTVTGTNVTANSIVLQQLTGTTGGAGTYQLSQTSTVASPESMVASATPPVVSFNSISGALVVTSGITGVASTAAYATGTLAAPLFLTSASGAVLSQGAAAATPAAFMNALIGNNVSWGTFMTLFDPDGGSGNTIKLAFAEWNSQQEDQYMYVCWDTDASPTVTVPATGSMGYILNQNETSGTFMLYRTLALGDGANIAAFVCGLAASIDFTEENGRVDFDYKYQAGLAADVTNETEYDNLEANFYNCYCASANATGNWAFLSPGSVSGEFEWADSYVNQIFINSGLETNLMDYLTSVKSTPYTQAGATAIEAAMQPTITAALNFGAFAPGVTLSASEQQQVNAMAGINIVPTLFALGYYVQVLQAAPSTRAARTSPPITFFYCDEGSVHTLDIASIEIQ